MINNENIPHKPVLLQEVMDNLLRPEAAREELLFVDTTFGAGGYSRYILEKGYKLIAFDVDRSVSIYAEKLLQTYPNSFKIIYDNYCNIDKYIKKNEITGGIVFDLGVSSMQLDQAERGFSFNLDGELDMRMNQGAKFSAQDFINKAKEEEIADILFHYADEHHSRKIAANIIRHRKLASIKYTSELKNIVMEVFPKKYYKTHPATKTFQAIRIYINNELEILENSLQKTLNLLNYNAKIAIVTFHSLEDRIVKNFFKDNAKPKIHISKYGKEEGMSTKYYPIEIINKSPIVPTNNEIRENNRARSAKLRVGAKR